MYKLNKLHYFMGSTYISSCVKSCIIDEEKFAKFFNDIPEYNYLHNHAI